MKDFIQLCSNKVTSTYGNHQFFARLYFDLFIDSHPRHHLLDNRTDHTKAFVVVFPNVLPKHSSNFPMGFVENRT